MRYIKLLIGHVFNAFSLPYKKGRGKIPRPYKLDDECPFDIGKQERSSQFIISPLSHSAKCNKSP